MKGNSANELYFAGSRGTIFRFDGVSFERIPLPVVSSPPPIIVNLAVTQGRIYARTSTGTVFGGSAGRLKLVTAPTLEAEGDCSYSFLVSAGDDPVLIGEGGCAARLHDGTWRSVLAAKNIPPGSAFIGVSHTASSPLLFWSGPGSIWELESKLREYRLPTIGRSTFATASPSHLFFISNGSLFRANRTLPPKP